MKEIMFCICENKDADQPVFSQRGLYVTNNKQMIYGFIFSYEPCHEKTCPWGFRSGLTQTTLYSHIQWLEATRRLEISD